MALIVHEEGFLLGILDACVSAYCLISKIDKSSFRLGTKANHYLHSEFHIRDVSVVGHMLLSFFLYKFS